jgi:hypothetical protein
LHLLQQIGLEPKQGNGQGNLGIALKCLAMVVAVQAMEGRRNEFENVEENIDHNTVEPEHKNDFDDDLEHRFIVFGCLVETAVQGIQPGCYSDADQA